MKTIGVSMMAAAAMLAGCEPGAGFQSGDRAAILMRLAEEEADRISSPKDRLTRQLNIANLQIGERRHADGRATLARARATLESAGKDELTDHERISGWVSISELSRHAGDYPSARSACQEGLGFLRTIQPVADRVQYLRGLAEELRKCIGKAASAKVLREGGQWVKTVEERVRRRAAFTMVAHDLFLCDDYDGGRDVLRLEDDTTWRTDTLIQLAGNAIPSKPMWNQIARPVTFEATYKRADYK
ncbi:MAG TPA: hypothetical protein VNA25_17795 [Phycisphaerae bacterium]|nr:hypothetical protein [Phycisphaerae bacterium]